MNKHEPIPDWQDSIKLILILLIFMWPTVLPIPNRNLYYFDCLHDIQSSQSKRYRSITINSISIISYIL